jgi:hypothetical protein
MVHLPHVFCAFHHGGEDLVVILAAAQVSGNTVRQLGAAGTGIGFRYPTVAMMKPDMQNAHWNPCSSMTPCCAGMQFAVSAGQSFDGLDLLPRTVWVSTEQE